MRFLLVGSLIALLAVTGAQAGIVPEPKIFLGGGFAAPVDPAAFTDGWGLGYGGRMGLGLGLTPALTIVGAIDYNYFGFDEDAFPSVSIDGGDLSTFYLSGEMRLNILAVPGSPVDPYLLGGVGYLRQSLDEPTVTGGSAAFPFSSDAENAFGFHIGGGVQLNLPVFADIFVEALYLVGFRSGDNTAFIPVRAGVSLDLGAGL
jgi:opacity protein-like surface antigen